MRDQREAEPDGITVEAEIQKRAARKSRKIARRLKRAARQTAKMASELEGKAEEAFSLISRGSGAFCTKHNFDPSIIRKRGEQAQRVHEEVRPATARVHASARSTISWKPPASAAGNLSARGPPAAASEQEEHPHDGKRESACSEESQASSALSRHPTPRSSASLVLPPRTPASLASRPLTARSHSDSQSIAKAREEPVPFNPQNTFLTTRNKGFTRTLAETAEDCRLPAWLQRAQIKRDEDKERERKQAEADAAEKKRLAAVAASLDPSRRTSGAGSRPQWSASSSSASSAIVYDRGMRSRGVICHTYQNAIAKPWGKLLSKDLKGAGVTGDTVMMRGGPGIAILVKEKGPAVPIWHTNGEFTDLAMRSRLKHQNYRPWFFYGA